MNIHNYNHLFYFYVVAKLNGVSIAAKHLNTSQSSLSTQIKTLESTLKKTLFKKVGRKIELTDSGREVYNYCRRAFETFDEMFDQIEKKSSSMGVRLSIGVSAEVERPFISEVLAKIARQYPKGQRPLFNLISLPTNQLVQLLKLGEIDLLIMTGGVSDSEIEIAAEFGMPVSLFSHADCLKNFKEKSFENILAKEELPLVLPSKLTSLRAEIDSFIIRKKAKNVCLFESNIIAAVVRAASDGLGCTILPEVYVLREVKSGRLFPVNQKPLWKHTVSVVVSRGQLGENKKTFIEKLQNHFKSNYNIDLKSKI